ncbi:CshA/CshB family fibrillar adhesin-related protein [Corynebacterium callunae]|uniref:CshA/CshB family fibrillar adhesin-related protein n=1 Tax=Corynebacterium callunae TaxID=1721 RepID=UPI00034CCEAF|nr:CshA/CshB family fibrillar adhesin-related protein [Corynebacterium callunae]
MLVFVLAQALPGLGLFSPPSANAQTAAGCHYRQGAYLDSSLCWIELTNVNDTLAGSASGQRVTIQLDASHTMSFTVKYNQGTSGSVIGNIIKTALPTWPGAVMGNTINGVTYYKAPTGVSTSTPMAFYSQRIASVNQVNPSVELRDIVVTNSSGASPSFGLVMADAESTNAGESLTMLSNTGVSELGRFVPPTYSQPCGGGITLATGTGGVGGTIPLSGLRCQGSAGNVGMLLGSTTNPSNIKVELGANQGGLQGVSLAVLMGGAKGTVATDQRADQGQTPKTNFNMELAYNNNALGKIVTTTGTAVSATSGTFLLASTTGQVRARPPDSRHGGFNQEADFRITEPRSSNTAGARYLHQECRRTVL